MPCNSRINRRFGLSSIKRHGAADHRKHIVEFGHNGKTTAAVESAHTDFGLQPRITSAHILATNFAAQQAIGASHQQANLIFCGLRIDRCLPLINGRRTNQKTPLPRNNRKRTASAAAARQIKRIARGHKRLINHNVRAAHDLNDIAASDVHHPADIIGPDTGAVKDSADTHLALAAVFRIL